jgi:hypothetical protein
MIFFQSKQTKCVLGGRSSTGPEVCLLGRRTADQTETENLSKGQTPHSLAIELPNFYKPPAAWLCLQRISTQPTQQIKTTHPPQNNKNDGSIQTRRTEETAQGTISTPTEKETRTTRETLGLCPTSKGLQLEEGSTAET